MYIGNVYGVYIFKLYTGYCMCGKVLSPGHTIPIHSSSSNYPLGYPYPPPFFVLVFF